MAKVKSFSSKGFKPFGPMDAGTPGVLGATLAGPGTFGGPPKRGLMNRLDKSTRNLNDYAKTTPMEIGKSSPLLLNLMQDDPKGSK